MRLIIVGPGRAGMSVAKAANAAGIEVVGLLGRGDVSGAALQVGAEPLSWDVPLPDADLVLIAVRDDAIAAVGRRVVSMTKAPLVHMSGMASLAVLESERRGSFHPLQTLPDPESGSARLAGASVALAASDPELEAQLGELADRLGMRAFVVDEEMRPLYHAAAAAASNFVVTALSMAHQLFQAAGVDPRHAEPLTQAVVDNVSVLGPDAALTGPVARGDVETVAVHLAAITAAVPDLLPGYRAMVAETARLAGTTDLFEDVLS